MTFPITIYRVEKKGRKEETTKKGKNDEKWEDYRQKRYQKIRVYPLNDNKGLRADTVRVVR